MTTLMQQAALPLALMQVMMQLMLQLVMQIVVRVLQLMQVVRARMLTALLLRLCMALSCHHSHPAVGQKTKQQQPAGQRAAVMKLNRQQLNSRHQPAVSSQQQHRQTLLLASLWQLPLKSLLQLLLQLLLRMQHLVAQEQIQLLLMLETAVGCRCLLLRCRP
jgi:hypothetical protein